MTGSLHDGTCHRDSEGELVCSCVPILVQESPASRGAGEYHSMVGVATNTGNMRAARIGATPPVRAVRHSGVDE